MSGILKKSLLAVCFVFISTAVVFAATYWLPDYEGYSSLGDKKPGPNLPGGDDDGGDKRQKTCEDFNMHSIGNVPKGTTCKTAYPGFGLRCYSNCRCTAEYTYTSQTQTDLFCSGSCTDDNGETKYKCSSCCPSGYKFEPTDMVRPQVVGWTRCGGLKDESASVLSGECRGGCYRCVDVCGSGKKYCRDTDSCAPSNGCCSDADCGGGSSGMVVVGSEGKTRCDMSTHTCTYPLCESGYTESKPACPNGKSLCQQEGNPGCWGCCGVECNANYSTATTAESCKDGQTFETQGDNELCGICKGNICAAGYSTEVKNCPAPNSLESDANNKACTRCLTCEARGQIACGSRCIAVTSCCTNGTEGCGAGQKCSNGTCVTKTCEEMGQKTCGTTCIATTSCCSNGTEGCGAGQKCDGTGKCVAKTCEEQGLKTCGTKCIATTACCTNGAEGCGAGQKCDGTGKCVTKTCEEMGQKTCGGKCIATTACCSNGTEGCGAGQKCDGTGKCIAKTCEEQGLKTCGTKCIATTACCTNGAEGCGAGQKCDGTGKCIAKTCEEQGLKTCGGKCIATTACCTNSDCDTGYACTNNTCTEIPCEAGYEKINGTAIICDVDQEKVYQATNPNCAKCQDIVCETGYSPNAMCLKGELIEVQASDSRCKKCVGDLPVIDLPTGKCDTGQVYCTGTYTVKCQNGKPLTPSHAMCLSLTMDAAINVENCGQTRTYEWCCTGKTCPSPSGSSSSGTGSLLR